MKGTPNVVRRGGFIHYRRSVPRALVARVGRGEITVSLQTNDHRLARLRGRQMYIATERLFAQLEDGMLSEDTIARLVQDFYDLVGQIDQVNRLAQAPLSEGQHKELLAFLGKHREGTAAELGRGDYSLASLAATIAIARSKLTLDALERRQLEQGLMRAGLEASKSAEARWAGDFNYKPVDGLLQQGQLHATVPSQPVSATAAPNQVNPAKTGPAFSELSKTFIRHQQGSRLWDPQTVQQAKKTFSIFTEVCGDRQLRSYAREDATRFKETLQSLPSDYGKAAAFRGLTTKVILELDQQRKVRAAPLSTRTVKRHFSALSALWRWAIVEQKARENPFTGFTFPSALRANEQRDMWSAEELKALFASPIWRGAHSSGRRSAVGNFVIRDEKYWLPLVALYSGLRQEEICQLHLEDVRKVDGHLVFDINGRPPRKLKNRNAVRKVPVHSQLKELGFLDYAQTQRDAGGIMLFPNLSRGGADDRLGHGFSKWFARYRQNIGIYRKGLDFHSFRHTATTMMQRAGVPIAAIDELTGHATPGETARYSHGLSASQLVAGIESISFDAAILPTFPPRHRAGEEP